MNDHDARNDQGTPDRSELQSMSADAFLRTIRDVPSLTEPAPSLVTARMIDRRWITESHPCVRCGNRAWRAFVAHCPAGDRWLDMCLPCSAWLNKSVTREFTW